MPDTTRRSWLARHRGAILLAATILFLPPLSLVFQLTGDERFCGTWCPRMFFVWRLGQSWSLYWMGYLRAYLGATLVAVVLITTFFFGRHWCSHLCPIGGLMELGSRLVPRFLKIDYSGVPAAPFRYGYLLVYLLAPAAGVGSLCCGYCHFATVPRLLAAPFSEADAAYFLRTAGQISLGLVVVLGFLARGGRTYCNLLCPVGAIDALAGLVGAKLGRRRMSLDPAKCQRCGRCIEACPTWAIEEDHGRPRIDPLSCMPCRQCQTACPTGAIVYEKASR